MKKTASTPRRVKRAAALPAPTEGSCPEAANGQSVVTSYRWAWYGLALLVPYAGILTAIFLYGQESLEVRRVGRHCLVLSFLFWVVFPVFMMLFILFMTLLVGFQILSDILPALN